MLLILPLSFINVVIVFSQFIEYKNIINVSKIINNFIINNYGIDCFFISKNIILFDKHAEACLINVVYKLMNYYLYSY